MRNEEGVIPQKITEASEGRVGKSRAQGKVKREDMATNKTELK